MSVFGPNDAPLDMFSKKSFSSSERLLFKFYTFGEKGAVECGIYANSDLTDLTSMSIGDDRFYIEDDMLADLADVWHRLSEPQSHDLSSTLDIRKVSPISVFGPDGHQLVPTAAGFRHSDNKKWAANVFIAIIALYIANAYVTNPDTEKPGILDKIDVAALEKAGNVTKVVKAVFRDAVDTPNSILAILTNTFKVARTTNKTVKNVCKTNPHILHLAEKGAFFVGGRLGKYFNIREMCYEAQTMEIDVVYGVVEMIVRMVYGSLTVHQFIRSLRNYQFTTDSAIHLLGFAAVFLSA